MEGTFPSSHLESAEPLCVCVCFCEITEDDN